MRTRSNWSIVETSNVEQARVRAYGPTWIDGEYGPDACLPAVLGDVVATQNVSTDGPFYSGGEITDLVSEGRGIKPVNHVKRIRAKLPRVHHISKTNVYWWHQGYLGPTKAAPQYLYENSLIPWFELRSQLGGGLMNIADGDGSTIGLSDPPDRLSELPARIVKRLEAIHASTILFESRELPGLFRMFTRRGEFGRELLRQWKNLRYGDLSYFSSSQGVKNFMKQYREGHLGYAFGIAPTVRDALSVTEEILRKRQQKKVQFIVTLKGRDDKTSQKFDPARGSYINGQLFEVAAKLRVDGARVTYRRPPGTSEFYDQMEQFKNRWLGANPLGNIWEVLPLSFCVDWLLSIDQVIDSLWLQNQSTYQIEYWSSVKTAYHQSYACEVPIKVSGVYPVPEYEYSKIGPVINEFESYGRELREPPNPLSSVRIRGANVYNTYLAILIALGLRRSNR